MTSRIQSMVKSYRDSYLIHGDSPASLLTPKGRQDLRFGNCEPYLPKDTFNILDFGCGLGHLLDFIGERRQNFSYHGVDLVPEFIEHCSRRSDQRAHFDLVSPDWLPTEHYDVVFISGVFNIKRDEDAELSRRLALDTIKSLFGHARHALICDFLTSMVDFEYPDALHFDPSQVAKYTMEELSRRFVIHHEYLPYEFAIVALSNSVIKKPQSVYELDA